MVAPHYFTADMVRALPDDGNRRLVGTLWVYLEAHPVGQLFSSPADLSWGPDILVQPDLFVVDPAQAGTLDWSRMQRLLLAVEVLSPSSTRADRFTKRVLYQHVGIPASWLVDADARAVEVWTPGAPFPVVEDETLRWAPDGASAPLELDLGALFAR